MKKFIENEEFTLVLEDGLMKLSLKERVDLDEAVARRCVEERLKLSEGTSYPLLVDPTLADDFSLEARNYLAKEGHIGTTAIAVLTRSPVKKMVANLFIILNKPVGRIKLFKKEEKAIKWLERFKNED